LILLAGCLLIGLLAAFFYPRPNDSGSRMSLPPPVPANETSRTVEPVENKIYLGPGSPLSPRLLAADGDGREDVRVLREITGAMLSSLKDNLRPPLGLNPDFAKVLRGENRLGLVFIPARHPAFGEDGRLLDRWGTPFHFHPVAPDRVDLRSAGPDRVLFTNDDFVAPWAN
jgi:hypothetical protein